jgi:hypothetical protein
MVMVAVRGAGERDQTAAISEARARTINAP